MIALITMPFWAHLTPNLGPPLLKAYLKEHGYVTRILDINIHAYNIRGQKYASKWELSNGWELSDEAIIEYWEDNLPLFQHYIDRLVTLNPKAVGFTTYYTSFGLSKIFAAALRRALPRAKIIFGGPSVAGYMNNAEELLGLDYIDAICTGEGEKALVYFMRELDRSGLEGDAPIPGIVYRSAGRLIRAPVENVKKLDDLPFPDFSDYDLSLYSAPNQFPSYVSRGCPNHCNYCTERNFFEGVRIRSAERVLAEFEHIAKNYPQVNYIRFFDSISNAKTSMLEKFCDLKIASGNRLQFNLENAVIRKEMRLPLYRKLKRAGCTLLGYGLETSSQDLLKSVGKLLALGVDIPAVLADGKRAGLKISVNVMFGLPGETEEHFEKMVEFLRSNRRALSGVNPAVNFCAYYPGSYVAMDPAKFGVDLSLGPNFWSTLDGRNTYLVRMQRFERFLKIAKESRLNNLLETDVLPNRNALLFEYFVASGDMSAALETYPRIEPGFLTPNLIRAHRILQGEEAPQAEITIDSYIANLPEQADHAQSLSWMIDNYLGASISFNSGWDQDIHPVKNFIRRLALRIIGFDRIQKRLNGQMLMMKLLVQRSSVPATRPMPIPKAPLKVARTIRVTQV